MNTISATATAARTATAPRAAASPLTTRTRRIRTEGRKPYELQRGTETLLFSRYRRHGHDGGEVQGNRGRFRPEGRAYRRTRQDHQRGTKTGCEENGEPSGGHGEKACGNRCGFRRSPGPEKPFGAIGADEPGGAGASAEQACRNGEKG